MFSVFNQTHNCIVCETDIYFEHFKSKQFQGSKYYILTPQLLVCLLQFRLTITLSYMVFRVEFLPLRCHRETRQGCDRLWEQAVLGAHFVVKYKGTY